MSIRTVYVVSWDFRGQNDYKVGPLFTDLNDAFAYFGVPEGEYVHSTELVRFDSFERWRKFKRKCWIRTDDEHNYWIHEREIEVEE